MAITDAPSIMALTYNLQAVVLAREDWREHDCLVTLYTRERGKLEALARGLRKMESKLAAHLEPFIAAEVFLVQGRRWPILAGSVVEDARLGLRADLSRLVLAGAAAALADRLTPLESRDERVYRLLDDTLALIAADEVLIQSGSLLVHLFAWKLLVFSGYRPELKRCLRCRRRSAVGAVKLHTQRGGTIHRSCLGADGAPSLAVSLPALKGLSYMAEAPIADALRLRGTAAAFAEMAAAIASLVEARFEQPFDFPAGPTP